MLVSCFLEKNEPRQASGFFDPCVLFSMISGSGHLLKRLRFTKNDKGRTGVQKIIFAVWGERERALRLPLLVSEPSLWLEYGGFSIRASEIITKLWITQRIVFQYAFNIPAVAAAKTKIFLILSSQHTAFSINEICLILNNFYAMVYAYRYNRAIYETGFSLCSRKYLSRLV